MMPNGCSQGMELRLNMVVCGLDEPAKTCKLQRRPDRTMVIGVRARTTVRRYGLLLQKRTLQAASASNKQKRNINRFRSHQKAKY